MLHPTGGNDYTPDKDTYISILFTPKFHVYIYALLLFSYKKKPPLDERAFISS